MTNVLEKMDGRLTDARLTSASVTGNDRETQQSTVSKTILL